MMNKVQIQLTDKEISELRAIMANDKNRAYLNNRGSASQRIKVKLDISLGSAVKVIAI